MVLSDYDQIELALRSQLERFLTNLEATRWLHTCFPGHIELALKRYGHTRMAYTMGIRGVFGLKPEIKERRAEKVPKIPGSNRKTDRRKLRKLLEDLT